MTISMASIRSFTFAVIAGLTLAGCGYNTIPTLEEQAKAKWGDVQNNYQRRADLIPNLVATVQGYAKQERDVLTSVIEARAKATQIKVDASQLTDPEKVKQFQDAQNQLSGALDGSSPSARTIPSSNPTRTSLPSSLSLRAPKIALRLRAATTLKRCARITPSFAHSPESYGPIRSSVATNRWRNSRRAKVRTSRRTVKF